LIGKWNPQHHYLRSTHVDRAYESGKAFARGAFPEDAIAAASHVEKFPEQQDHVLRFFKHCKSYTSEVRKNKRAFAEVDAYKHSIDGPIAQWLSAQLRFEVTTKEVMGVWSACVTDLIRELGTERWCSLLRPQDLEALSIVKDMKAHIKMGHGNELSYKIAKPLLRYIVDSMEEHVGSTAQHHPSRHSLKALFGHAETVSPLIALLGLFPEEKPRRWQTSRITPFATNVEFVVHRCQTGEVAAPSHRVLLRHHQQKVAIPGCTAMYCPLDDFKRIVDERLNGIDFEAMCAPRSLFSLGWWHTHTWLWEGILLLLFLFAAAGLTWALARYKNDAREQDVAMKLA